MREEEDFITRLSKDRERRIALENKNNEMHEEKKSTKVRGSGMPETNNSSLQKSKSEELNAIQPEGLMPQSMHLGEAISRSSNLIDSTMKDLRSYMTGLFADAPDPSVQRLEVFRVETAVDCAKTINELMKTKLEAIKIAKTLTKGD